MLENKTLPTVTKYLGPVKSKRTEAHEMPAVPAAVKETSQRFAEAQAKVAEAQQAVAAAKADLARAEREDREAAKQAALAGKAIPDPTTPEAQQAVESAERLLHALACDAIDHGRVAFDAIVDHRDEWIEALEAENAKSREKVWRDLDAALAAIPDAMRVEKVIKNLHHVEPSRGAFQLPRFGVDLDSRPVSTDVLDRFIDLGKAIQGVRGRFKTLRGIDERMEAIEALRNDDSDEIRRLTAFSR